MIRARQRRPDVDVAAIADPQPVDIARDALLPRGSRDRHRGESGPRRAAAVELVDRRLVVLPSRREGLPVSALEGDNIATRSEKSPWYEGPSLLHHLEHVHIASDRNLVDVRFPVQYVIRPQSTVVTDYRGYAGQVASGVLKPGDDVMVLPSGLTTTIEAQKSSLGAAG